MGEIISKLLALYDSNLEFAGFITFFSLAALLYIFFQFILAWFNHHSARREYQYERSRSTGEARFEKEIFHLEKLSESLAQLVFFSISIHDNSIISKSKWRKLYEDSLASLGAAAPFIDYYNKETRNEWCGVASQLCVDCFAEGEQAVPTHSSSALLDTNASLFSRAIEILNSSSLLVQKTFSEDYPVTVFIAFFVALAIIALKVILFIPGLSFQMQRFE